MADTFTKGGVKYYKDPSRNGALVTVGKDEEAPAHFVSVSEEQLKAEAQKKQDESVTGMAKTFAARAASGLTALPQAAARMSALSAQMEDPRALAARGVGAPVPSADPTTLAAASRSLEANRAAAQEAGELNLADPSRPAWQQIAGQLGANEGQLAAGEIRRSAVNPITGMAGEVLGSAVTPSPIGLAKGALAKGALALTEGAVLGQVGAQTQARLEGRSVTSTAEDLTGMTVGGLLSGAVGALLGRYESAGRGVGKVVGKLADDADSALPMSKVSLRNAPSPIIRDADEIAYSASDLAAKGTKAPTEVAVSPAAADPLGFFSPIAKAIGKKQVEIGGAGQEIMDIVGVGSEHPMRDIAREVIKNPVSSRRAAAKDMGSSLKTLFETEDLIHDYNTDDAWRASNVEKLMGSSVDPEAARNLARQAASEGRDMSRKMVLDTAIWLGDENHGVAISYIKPHLGAITTMGDEFADIERRLAIPLGEDGAMSAAEGYAALNKMKRNSGKYVAKAMPDEANVRLLGAADIYHDIRAFLGSAEEGVDAGLYGKLRNFLEDESVWGAAGAVQREVNAGVHQAQGVSSKFLNSVANKMPAEDLMSRKKWVVDSAKMEALVDEIGQHPDGQLAIDLNNRLDAANRAVAALKKFEAPGFGDLEQVSKALPQARDAAKTAARNSQWIQQYREQILGAQSNVDTLRMAQPAMMGVMGAGIGGAVAPGLGGIVGAAAGLVSSVALRPAGTMFAAHRIRGMVGALRNGEFTSATRAIMNGGKSAANVAAQKVAPKEVSSLVGAQSGVFAKAAGVGGVAAFLVPGKGLEESYSQRVDEVRKLQSDSLDLIDRLHSQIPGLAEEDPELSAETVKATQKVLQWLSDKIPEGQAPRGMFAAQSPQPSRSDMLRFARDWSTATNPISVLNDAARGRLTESQVEAFKTLYPERYKALQEEAIDMAIEYATSSKIPYVQKIQLDTLLQLRGQGIPRLSVSTSEQILGKSKKSRTPKSASGLAEQAQTPEASWPSAR